MVLRFQSLTRLPRKKLQAREQRFSEKPESKRSERVERVLTKFLPVLTFAIPPAIVALTHREAPARLRVGSGSLVVSEKVTHHEHIFRTRPQRERRWPAH